MRLKIAAPRGAAGAGGNDADDRSRAARMGDYDGAMHAVRRLLAELETARAAGATPETFRQAHARIDDELALAATAAADVHAVLFDAAGGVHRAEVDPGVIRWKRRLNDALTLRSQHLMSQVDHEAARPIAEAGAGNRAAYGPHQAGLDFALPDESPLVSDVVDLDGGLTQTSAGSAQARIEPPAW